MAEYIEREAVLKILRGSAVAKYPSSFYVGLFAAGTECQCMYWKGLFDYCKPDDFCAYGERKDGEG